MVASPDARALPGMIRRSYVDLFLISLVSLFQELACIRWFGSTVMFLTFFTNLVLMASFLGISVGCLAARSRRDFIGTVLPLLLATMGLAFRLLWSYARFGELMIDVGGQSSPQQVYFGTEGRARDLSSFVIPLEVIAGVFFALVSLTFIGIGQTMGRAFNAIANPIEAYTVNLLGSLAGIAGFAGLILPPEPSLGLVCSRRGGRSLLSRQTGRASGHSRLEATGRAADFGCDGTVLVGGLTATADLPDLGKPTPARTIWSPYYKIRFEPENQQIYVNNIRHQAMVDLTASGAIYQVPYLMNRIAGGAPFEEVLIIGAGSGNDVAAALAQGAKHVDAVEIDPVIVRDRP